MFKTTVVLRMALMLLAALGLSLTLAAGVMAQPDVSVDPGDGVTVDESDLSATDFYTVSILAAPVGDITYTATTDGQCTITANDTVFISAGQTPSFAVTITAADDSVDENDPHPCTITHDISSVDDPDYDIYPLPDAPVVSVLDDDTAGISFSTPPVTLLEAGTTSDTYQISLDSTPTQDIVFSLTTDGECTVTSGATVTISATPPHVADVTIQVVDDGEAEGTHTCEVTHSLISGDATYSGLADAIYTANITDNDTAGITVTGTPVIVTEPNITASYTISLDSTPTDAVIINLTASGACTINGGQSADSVMLNSVPDAADITVEPVDDSIDNPADRSCTIAHTVSSSDPNYDGISVGDASVTVVDEDTAGVTFNPLSLTLNEGGAADTYEIFLNTLPDQDVNITVSANPAAQCSITSSTNLTITQGTLGPASVTVQAIDDADSEGNHPCSIVHAVSGDPVYSGITIPDYPITIIDNETASITISPLSGDLAEAGTPQQTYQIGVTLSPSQPVSVTAVPDSQCEVVGSPTAAFDSTDTAPKTITIRAIDDNVDEDSPHTCTIAHSVSASGGNYSGATAANLNASVIDDDTAQISIAGSSANEGSSGTTTDLTFTITLDRPADHTITVNWATADDSATTADNDYTAASGQITFAAFDTSETRTVTINGDSAFEPDEQFFVNLSGASGGVIVTAQAAGIIQNDDAAPVVPNATINPAPDVTELGAGQTSLMTFTVTLDATPTSEVTVDWATLDGSGTAAAGSDYVSASGTLTFVAGDTSETIEITINGDDVDETPDTEAVVVGLSNPGGLVIATAQASGDILDDDATVVVPEVNIADFAGNELNSGISVFSFTVTLSAPTSSIVTVNYQTEDNGSATAGVDYTAASGQVTFQPNDVSETIEVNVSGDTTPESDETFIVRLTSAVNATIPAGSETAVGTIYDDDSITASIGDASLVEGNSGEQMMRFTVTLSALPPESAAMNYSTAGVTAVDGVDFRAQNGSLTFTSSDLERHIDVPIIGDMLVEGDETFVVDLSGDFRLTITDRQAVGTIIDDDVPPPDVSISLSPDSVDEAGGTISFTVTLSALPASFPVSVGYTTADNGSATAGQDYGLTSGTITWASASDPLSQSIAVTITDDTLDEPDETFLITLNNPSGVNITTGQVTATILDNDEPPATPNVSISLPSASVSESAGTITFNVTLSALPASLPVSVDYTTAVSGTGSGHATADVDYTTRSGTITWDEVTDPLSQSVAIPITNDTLDEPNETFLITISNPTPSTGLNIVTGQVTATIQDDDSPPAQPTIRINDAQIAEGNSGQRDLIFAISLSSAASGTVTVNYATANDTAAAGSDYVAANGTVTFNAGQMSRSVTIRINGDTTVEPDERFHVNLSGATGGATISDNRGVGTIINDDGGPTPTPTITPTPRPTETPIPPVPLCADLNGTTNPIIRAQAPAGTVTNGNVYCRVLAENGRFVYVGEEGSIGNQQVLNLGVIHAVDVFGLRAAGEPAVEFNNSVLVCLQGAGSLIYLDARGAPRPPVRLTNTSSQGGYTCGNIPHAGTVVLTGSPGDLPGIVTGSGGGGSGGPRVGLSDCQVTTMMRLNLRVWPGLDGRVLTIVPEGATLPAFERTRRWYHVQFEAFDGWISAFYVRPQGNCGD